MPAKKKSTNINKNYPVLGYRVTKAEKESFDTRFAELMESLNQLPEYQRVNLKKNAVFLWILDLGIEELKKQKDLELP